MAVQSGRGYSGISSILMERMSDIRTTYEEEHKKRLGIVDEKKTRTHVSSFKSGQANYTSDGRK